MILWDVSLFLYFLSVIEDTISFKFGGVCVGYIFACFRRILGLLFVNFSFFLACLKTEPCHYVPTYFHLAIL